MLEKIGHYSLTNPASVYDEEALTALELAGRTAGKVNECVNAFNKLESETDAHLKAQDEAIPVKIGEEVVSYIEDGAFDEAIDKYAGDLTDRLDNLVAESGNDNTELVDARLATDGTVYDNTGMAIRAQVREVEKGTVKPNLIDEDKLIDGFIQSSGDIYKSHQSGTFNRWEYTSDFIPVDIANRYTFSALYDSEVAGWYCIATYDADKKFIARPYVYEFTASEYARTFTLYDENIAYVRISYRSYMTGRVKFEVSRYASQIPERPLKNNLLESHPLIFDGYIVDNGSIYPQTSDGYIESEPAVLEKYSRFIPVNAGEEYTLYHVAERHAWCAVGIYGSDGKALSRPTTNASKFTFTIPEGAVTIMVSARTLYMKDIALFKTVTPMTAEQKVRENYIGMLELGERDAIVFGDTVKAINHRGYNTVAPENTLPAFKLSADNGFKYVECDVSFTSDGVPVLLHDATVDRTSDGTGDISSLTFDAVRALDFGSWKSEEYAGTKIPSFAEFIVLCKSLGLHAYVEIKSSASEAQVKLLVDIVRMHGMREHVSFISFVATNLEYVKKYDAKARLGYVVDAITEDVIATASALKTDTNEVFIDASLSGVGDDVVAMCASADLPLEVWTVNAQSSIVSMNPYISGVTSDNLRANKVLYENTITGVMTEAPDNLPTGEESGSGEGEESGSGEGEESEVDPPNSLKGEWRFNNTITTPPSEVCQLQDINFTSDGEPYIGIFPYQTFDDEFYYMTYYGEDSSRQPYTYGSGWSSNDTVRTVDFGSTAQTVEEAFYNWFTANATKTS